MSLRAATLAPPARFPAAASALPRRAADVLVDILGEAGVEVVFGLPGGVISPVFDALLDSPLRSVVTRHENGALFAAAGYAHTTGRLGVAAVTSGPGALNALTGLASAWCDGLPVLLLVGEVPRAVQGKGVLQDSSAHGLDLVAMARRVSKLALEVPTATQLPTLLQQAITTALADRRGPVVLTLPMDVTTATLRPPRVVGSVRTRIGLPEAALDEIAGLLQGAERPLLLVGSGVRGSSTDGREAPALLRRVAERLGCPVATTPKAKGVFPESHPLALGVFGLGGHPSSRAYLEAGVDVLVALGTSLGDLASDGFSPALQAPPTFVHVDLDLGRLAKSFAPTHAVLSSAGGFLAGLERRLTARPQPTQTTTASGVVHHAVAASTRADRIAPQVALAEIQSLLPADTIYTVDSGEHFLFATHFLRLDHPDAWVVMSGLGAMGQALGAALGAQLAHPHRCCAAIVGDGGFAMSAFEVATAAAEGLPLRVFVFNDACLGMVENGHRTVYGRSPSFATGPLDVGAVAAGLGAATFRVEGPGDLVAKAELLRCHPGPVVVDVRLDPALHLPRKDRVGAFAPKPAAA